MSDLVRKANGQFDTDADGEQWFVNYKADRPLLGAAADKPIAQIIAGAEWVDYFAVPGMAALHKALGIVPEDGKTNMQDYETRRDAFFAQLPVFSLPIRALTFTQPDIDADDLDHPELMNQDSNPVSVIVTHLGEYYLIDGHHRTIGQYLQGKTQVAAHVFNP